MGYVPESKYLKDTWTIDGPFNSINSIVNKQRFSLSYFIAVLIYMIISL